MKSSIRLVGVTLLTGSLSLGGTVLAAGAASADTGLRTATTTSGTHGDVKDDTCKSRHDSSNGSYDSKGRFHERGHSGWCDDNGNHRSDDDYNGRWHDGNGCEHDRWGWWSHDGRYNWDDHRDDRSHSRDHDDGNKKAGDHKSDNKSDHKSDHKSDDKSHKKS